MLDSAGLVAGAADYEPFGHVNRVTQREATAHPYPDDEEESFTGFVQPPENGQVKVRMRGIYQLMDMEEGEDFIKLVDVDTGQVLSQKTGVEVGRQVTGWVQPSNGGVHVNLVSGPMGSAPNAYTGAVVEGYEYQRYQTGAQPFWTPLRFPGHYYDAETDLFENWNRYYDPSIGRYLQPEPLLAEGPFALPAYSYAVNNPLGFVDPSGGAPLPAWLWIRSTTKMGLGIGAWANGTGPHVVTFGPDSAEVQAMRLSNSFEYVRQAFYDARRQAVLENYSLGNFNQLSVPGCTELFGNPFGFSIGKYDAYFRPNADGKTVSIVLYNKWSISSLGHGNFDGPDELPSYEALPWIPSPMSNVHQFFFWTETLP
jgi:RHS repeat-associated protein